jgi:hypothetical protein
MAVKSLAELKRALQKGAKFKVIDHHKVELVGLIREVNIAKTACLYSKVFNDPTHEMSTCNGGKGSYMRFEKADHYEFQGDTVFWYEKPVGTEGNKLIMAFQLL